MTGTIVLQSGTIVGIPGSHEEGDHHVGLLVVSGLFVIGEMAAKLFHNPVFLDTATECGTDKSKGEETMEVGIIIFDKDMVEGFELTELTGIGLLLVGSMRTSKPMTEET